MGPSNATYRLLVRKDFSTYSGNANTSGLDVRRYRNYIRLMPESEADKEATVFLGQSFKEEDSGISRVYLPKLLTDADCVDRKAVVI